MYFYWDINRWAGHLMIMMWDEEQTCERCGCWFVSTLILKSCTIKDGCSAETSTKSEIYRYRRVFIGLKKKKGHSNRVICCPKDKNPGNILVLTRMSVSAWWLCPVWKSSCRTLSGLCLGTFFCEDIKVWRQKQGLVKNGDMPHLILANLRKSHVWQPWWMKYVAAFGAAPPRQDVYEGGRQDLSGAIYLPFGVINIHDQSSAMRHQKSHQSCVLWWLLMTTQVLTSPTHAALNS